MMGRPLAVPTYPGYLWASAQALTEHNHSLPLGRPTAQSQQASHVF